jgi:hypothetical protein
MKAYLGLVPISTPVARPHDLDGIHLVVFARMRALAHTQALSAKPTIAWLEGSRHTCAA